MKPVQFGQCIVPHASISEQIQLTVLAEKLGFDAAWWPDHMLFIDGAPGLDCWTVMAAAATRTSRIQLGTAVSDAHRIHPAVFAQRAATLDQLSKGRVIVGLGSGESMNLDPYGIAWKDKKVRRLREFVRVFRGLLDSREPFTFEGAFQQTRAAVLQVHPYKNRHIPLFMASLGPQMQKLAGEVADGWLPVVVPAAHYAHYFEPIAASARAAGRDPEKIERVATLVFALVDEKRPLSRSQLAAALRPFAGVLVWEPAARQMGLDFEPPEHLREAGFHCVNPCDPDSMRRFEEYLRWIPEEVLIEFAVAGGPERIVQEVERYIAAGVTHLQVINASPDPVASTFWFAREVMPRYNGRRPTPLARALNILVKPFARLGLTRRVVPAELDIWKKAGL